MAVKIVRTEPSPEVVKQVVCKSCGVTLEYLPVDVQRYHGTDYGGGPDGREWVKCPNCNKDVTLKSW